MIALLTSPLVGPATWAPVAREIADRAGSVAVVEEMQRLPLGYFTSSVPVPPGWPAPPGAYLAFGDQSYEDDIA